jgi:putative transcriptional regulator
VAGWRQDSLAVIALAIALIAPSRVFAGADEAYFLVATRDLHDPVFSQTVILILPVSEDGLVEGVIINKPTKTRVNDLINGAAVLPKPAESAFFGGPVETDTPMILMRATRAPTNAIHVFEDVYVVVDPAQINADVKAPPEASGVRLIVGRAQWIPEQLLAEMAEGSWYKAPAEADTVFSPEPAKVWEELVKRGQLQEADEGANSARSCLAWAAPKRVFGD